MLKCHSQRKLHVSNTRNDISEREKFTDTAAEKQKLHSLKTLTYEPVFFMKE